MSLVMYSQARRPMRGKGVLGDVFNFTKKNKLISRGLTMAAPMAGSYSPLVAGAGALAGLLGFGKRPRRRRAVAKKKKPVKRRRVRR